MKNKQQVRSLLNALFLLGFRYSVVEREETVFLRLAREQLCSRDTGLSQPHYEYFFFHRSDPGNSYDAEQQARIDEVEDQLGTVCADVPTEQSTQIGHAVDAEDLPETGKHARGGVFIEYKDLCGLGLEITYGY